MTIDYEAEILKRDQQIAELLKRNQEMVERNQKMAEEIKRLKEILTAKGKAKGSNQPKFKLNYSLAGTQRRSKPGKQATGRYPSADKIAQVSANQSIYPDSIASEACELHRHQCVWRILDGKAAYVDYAIYAEPESAQVPEVPGVRNRRSEYGVEIILMVPI